ncbi:otoancorin-like [Melanaphis sacchari]|uniref:otoancorin-like n=1 Tax=Melanaphis sacchari TaxID=742174 RepID=UPI000DC14E17|nr:otoancorin-like [Melanaphis sacchari]
MSPMWAYLLVFFLSVIHKDAAKQSCDGESLMKNNDKLSKEDVDNLISIDNQSQIKMCLVVLGKEPLETGIAELLWRDLVKVYTTADDIPEDELQLLGWISIGIPAQDFMNLSLTDIDTIASFGKWRNYSKEQLMALKQAIEDQWSYKGPSDLSSYDLTALGQVLCVFNKSYIAAIKPMAYKAAAADLSNLVNCPREIVKEFALLAISKDAFGDPSGWTAIQIALIGCVIAGLDSVRDIQPDAFEGLSASNMQCLPNDVLQAMSTEQLSQLSLSAVNALTHAQRSSLDRQQIEAIQETANTLGAVLNDGCFTSHTTWPTVTLIIIAHLQLTTLIIPSYCRL